MWSVLVEVWLVLGTVWADCDDGQIKGNTVDESMKLPLQDFRPEFEVTEDRRELLTLLDRELCSWLEERESLLVINVSVGFDKSVSDVFFSKRLLSLSSRFGLGSTEI